MLTAHLEKQLGRLRETIAGPFRERIVAAEGALQDFLATGGSPMEREAAGAFRLREMEAECENVTREVFAEVAAILKKDLVATETAGMRECWSGSVRGWRKRSPS